jgi:hypothetical protein
MKVTASPKLVKLAELVSVTVDVPEGIPLGTPATSEK